MGQAFDVDDVLAPKPSPRTLLWRGITKSCPRCGGRGVFDTWFRMKDRCPRCGYRFEREPGFFVGAYWVNFVIAESFLVVPIGGYIIWKSQSPDATWILPMIVGLVIGVFGPMLTYPYSRTIWSAVDLLMTPLDMEEIVEAVDAVADERPDAPGPGEACEPT